MGDRVSIQFKNGDEKSVVLFSHWDGMNFVKRAKDYVKNILRACSSSTISHPLNRKEPQTVMVDFVKWYMEEIMDAGDRVESNYYFGFDEDDGDNSDNGHHIIDVNEAEKKKEIVTFKVRVNKSAKGENLQVVTGELIQEDNKTIKVNNFKRAIEAGETQAIRTYLKNNIIGEIARIEEVNA